MDGGGNARRVLRSLRRRVRLRTRLRHARQLWRRGFRRRLPPWPADLAAQPVVKSGDGQVEVLVPTCGVLRRTVTDMPVESVRVVVRDWQPPWPAWSGQAGALPGLRHQRVELPLHGRGEASVELTLAEPVPLPEVVAAVRPVFDPSPVAADPRDRQRYGPGLPQGTLVVDPAGWRVVRAAGGVALVAGRVDEPLDEHQRAVLAQLGLVRLLEHPGTAAVAVRLAMTGVVLHAAAGSAAATLGSATGGVRLASELLATVTAPLPGRDPFVWEARSVRQRRAAMRHHAAGLATPSTSALLVSKRPELALAQVRALAGQTYPKLEVVVALHGSGAPAGLREAAGDRPLQVIEVPADRNLGEALQAAADAASGDLLTKVDDDDRYGPEHVWDVVLARHYSGATITGKGADLVHLRSKDLTVRRRMAAETYTDTVAGGTLTLARGDLRAAGGWPPVPKHVDRALLDRVLAGGGLVYRTHPLGFVYTRHGDGHTWDADLDYFLHDIRRRWRGLPPHAELGGS